MSRISIPSTDQAPSDSQPRLTKVHAAFGVVPNLFRLLAVSPAVLDAYSVFAAELNRTFDPQIRERIAIAVAAANGCDYCVSAHSYLAEAQLKLSGSEINLSRKASSSDAKIAAALRFAADVAGERGRVSDASLASVRDAGFADSEIVEIVALVALNALTNFMNNVAQTEIDFPVIEAVAA